MAYAQWCARLLGELKTPRQGKSMALGPITAERKRGGDTLSLGWMGYGVEHALLKQATSNGDQFPLHRVAVISHRA
jgi:hypothetical protein